jgi:hypothetical protein
VQAGKRALPCRGQVETLDEGTDGFRHHPIASGSQRASGGNMNSITSATT